MDKIRKSQQDSSSQDSRKRGWDPNLRSACALKSQSPSGLASLRQRLRKRRRRRRLGSAGVSHVTGAPGVGSSLPKMASLLQSERVLYLVQGEKKVRAPLSQLYFCRYCSELRSLECVSHEVTGPPAPRGLCAGGGGGGARPSHCCWRKFRRERRGNRVSSLLIGQALHHSAEFAISFACKWSLGKGAAPGGAERILLF